MGDNSEMDEGLLESNLPKREYNKERELVYYKAREVKKNIKHLLKVNYLMF